MIGEEAKRFGAASETTARAFADQLAGATSGQPPAAGHEGTAPDDLPVEELRRRALAVFERAAPGWQSASPHGYLVAELRAAIERAHPATLRQFALRARTEQVAAG